MKTTLFTLLAVSLAHGFGTAVAVEIKPVAVEGQPLAANINRLLQALDMLGAPLSNEMTTALTAAAKARDAAKLQALLDPRVLFVVSINPESRVKVERGPAPALL